MYTYEQLQLAIIMAYEQGLEEANNECLGIYNLGYTCGRTAALNAVVKDLYKQADALANITCK